MPAPLFILDVETHTEERHATLRLGDEAGRHLAAWEVQLDQHPASRWSAKIDQLLAQARSAP